MNIPKDWKKLTVDELIIEWDKGKDDTPVEYQQFNVALVHLVREGKAIAYLLPNGEIKFAHASCVEETK